MRAVTSPRVLASYRLTFFSALGGALINAVFGFLVAWVLVRYTFPFKRVVDAIVDLPFALPTHPWPAFRLPPSMPATAGSGSFLSRSASRSRSPPAGVLVALTFIGLPFVVRTVQPVLEEFERRAGRSGRMPRRVALADVQARRAARGVSSVADRLRAGFRARARRIRLGDFHRRQCADEVRDHDVAG